MPRGTQVGTSIDDALAVLRRGGLVGIPTETVYGLAADARNEQAVRRIFSTKGRPADHPLIVHIADAALVGQWACDLPPAAAILAGACWPGPLTLLLRRRPDVLDAVTGGRDTVGVRVPAHPLTGELLARFGGGLAAPSANLFGQVSPTTAAHVAHDLGDLVDYVLDGGACPIGVESTIVDCTTAPPQILRPGGISVEQIVALLGEGTATSAGAARAPGMLPAHYAPRAKVVLAESGVEAAELAGGGHHVLIVDRTGDLVEYARELYSDLRRADELGVSTIIAVLPPAAGLGHAIRDRLAKAAAAGAAINDR